MWRDLNKVYPDGTRYLGSPRVGEVASDIPSTGDHGAALAYANVVENGWTTERVLFWVRSWNLSTLWVYDDSSWVGTVTADGTYTITGDIYVDDAIQATQATITLYVGVAAPPPSTGTSIVTNPYADWQRAVLPNELIPRVLIVDPSTGAVVLSLVNQTTASDGTLTIENDVLTAGTPYLVVSFNTAGTSRGIDLYEAA